MKRWALAMILTSLLALGACDSGSDSGSDSASDTKPGAAAGSQSASGEIPDPHYAVFPAKVPGPGWELTDAIRMLGTGREVQLGGLPGIDWYAEYEGPVVEGDANAYLSLTGFVQSLEERRAESGEGLKITEGDINGHKAFWTYDAADGAVVTWEITPDYTLEVFATGLSLEDTLAMARSVKDASEAEWVAAGGVVADCKPTQTACPDTAED